MTMKQLDSVPEGVGAEPQRRPPLTTTPGERAGEDLTRSVSGNTIERSDLSPGAPDETRERQIREAAYRRAEQRGFAPGAELDDWLAAEREVNEASGGNSVG
jgi:hypothetical protein